MKKEAQFEKAFAKLAALKGARYFKIPDTRMLTARNRYKNREEKRPFDGVFVTKNETWCLEFKINYNKLSPHQAMNKRTVDIINSKFAVVTEIEKKSGIVYKLQIGNKTTTYDNLSYMITDLIQTL